ncbi:hypothetical protein F5882DRAFT_110904 [Hyaloscypha sp. PMI_1271]|nr:hypothetical protein F5882DRAFT_110904 [Hyaloscypha sp. PMI_1271]
MGMLNLEAHPAPLEGTPSCIDTNAQRVNFAELSDGQYPMTVSQVSTPPSANPSLAHVEGRTYLKNAPALQGDSRVRIESSEKMNRDPVQHETVPQPAQTLDSEENPAQLLAPKPNEEKKAAVEIIGKHASEWDTDEDPFLTRSDSIVPPTWEQLDAVDWTTTLESPDLTKAISRRPQVQPRNLSLADARTTQDMLGHPRILIPKRAPREESSSEGSEGTLRTRNIKHRPECLTLTDEQCRKIQAIVDPYDTRFNESWEKQLQPKLIRLYMAGKSFPQIEEEMGLNWSHKTYANRFRDWNFPTESVERDNMIKWLYASVSKSTHSTGLNSQVSEYQRSTIPSQALKSLTAKAHLVAESSPMTQGDSRAGSGHGLMNQDWGRPHKHVPNPKPVQVTGSGNDTTLSPIQACTSEQLPSGRKSVHPPLYRPGSQSSKLVQRRNLHSVQLPGESHHGSLTHASPRKVATRALVISHTDESGCKDTNTSEPSKYINEEQSDFVWYSIRDLGETFKQTRSRFKELFGENLSDHLTRIDGTTSLKRRRIACETKSRLVDVAPHRASKYPWVENYHKQEISEATLPSVALEYLRPFSAEALDFLWFLHFDLGFSAHLLLDTFRPRYLKEVVLKAHQADFKRRGIILGCGYTSASQMRTGPPVMREAYEKKYRLCDICPDAIRYNWIPDIFKFGMENPRLRDKAFQQFYGLSEKKSIEVMTVQLHGPLTFPGLKDMPESTFHYLCSKVQLRKHITTPKRSRKRCTRSCAGCVTCKSEGENCNGLQSSSKKGMVKEPSSTPPGISADVQQSNPEDTVSEY